MLVISLIEAPAWCFVALACRRNGILLAVCMRINRLSWPLVPVKPMRQRNWEVHLRGLLKFSLTIRAYTLTPGEIIKLTRSPLSNHGSPRVLQSD